MAGFYFIWVEGCVEACAEGPFESAELRDAAAKTAWQEDGDAEHAIFRMDIDEQGSPNIGMFQNGDLDDDAGDDEDGEEYVDLGIGGIQLQKSQIAEACEDLRRNDALGLND